ncbi:guanine nucleotide exchange factor DBS-like isoform X2 [Sitophilus oryzae]|uniref:Guanine nucleotide exchange factor DBS-like isoform X2 n=1 Tax=Sitophilus oryzae TaxID=7048 RepID=A0A6J2XBR7_SITOR|nr:guanine nucleotide exchange factor DBS-like isoform X2 [Sitophilus oryzae]
MSLMKIRIKIKEPLPTCEEIEMQNTVSLEPLGVNDVVDILKHHYAIISGGKSKDGSPIITFPDNNNFHMITDAQYQRLMLYLTSVPTLQEADMGFHLIIDRRKDRWNSVKAVLLKISVFFPGLIHVVYVLRPTSFLQKALSEVSNKLFKDEFKFRMVVLSTAEELHEYVSPNQLTADLKGSLSYNHEEWIFQRIELENFSNVTQQVSNALDEFTKQVDETELPNNVDSTQELLIKQNESYSDLKKEILSAAKKGEDLLRCIKSKNSSDSDNTASDMTGNVFAVERLLVQLEETEKTFDEFWQHHSAKLRHCLELRRFEQDFKELQVNFDSALKTVSDMTEIGETVSRVDTLIKETNSFEKICLNDIQRAEEAVSSGHLLMRIKNSCPIDCVEPKCNELLRMKDMLLTRLSKRKDMLVKNRELMEGIEKANKWCAIGRDLLASQKIEQCSNSPDLAEKYVCEIRDFLNTAKDFSSNGQKDFKELFQESITPETKALVSQVLQRIEDVALMCDKRLNSLSKLAVRTKRPVQTVMPEPAVPRQPLVGAPHPKNFSFLRKAYTIPKMDSTLDHEPDIVREEPHISPEHDEVHRIKTGHVLSELVETERVYVTELLSIIKGYKEEAQLEEHQHLLPSNANEKFDVIFGNLDDIYHFHSEYFLRDLENCISSTDLVALCFVQKREKFLKLYSFYCQNISKSEQLRECSNELNPFFIACQKKLGHKLPLAAYLLKPVQRITKYQLLLKDLLRYSDESKYCRELQQALECMLVVLKCVNDSMHQISITGFPEDLSQQGELLLQGSFSVWVENKKDIRLRLKPLRRHLFLYQKALLFCKPVSKAERNKATYEFKKCLKMSKVGLTESVKGDARRFEVWLEGRQEVHIIQAANLEQKHAWVNEIKKVLFNQLEEIKGEKIKQYAALTHRPLRQTTSWETQKHGSMAGAVEGHQRAMSCDVETANHTDESVECLEGGNWSSDCSNSDDDDHTPTSRGRFIALADYCAIGISEVNMREGDIVELLKKGCAGWWFVKVIGSSVEGWAPASYLECLSRKSFRGSSRSQDRLNDH